MHRNRPTPFEPSDPMNDLEKYFEANTGRLIHKWMHYFEIYDRHFARFRGTDVHIVEFGVSQGGSLDMWKAYFGPRCKIFGVDINPHCKALENEAVTIFIGDQENRSFLKSLAAKVPRIDILIDDGGHTMGQQIATFEELFDRIDPNGVYLCEDLHTSYWKKWGGGYGRRSTFIEYSKRFIDRIHAWHSQTPLLKIDAFTRSAHSLHYYDSILVIEKRPVPEPMHRKTGVATVPDYTSPGKQAADRLRDRLKSAVGIKGR
jgi:hypothetical protein